MTPTQPQNRSILRVLLVEDSIEDAQIIERELQHLPDRVECKRVDDAASMRHALAEARWDAILSDWSMPSFDALSALALLQESGIDVPFILVSGTVGEQAAVDAMRAGVRDCVLKENLGRLCVVVERELHDHQVAVARRASEARYRRIVETTNEGVWTVDAEGNTSFLNARMARMLGYRVDQIVGRSPFEFLFEEGRASLARYLSEPGSHTSEPIEVRFRRHDGTTLWALLESNTIYDDDGRYDGRLAMIMDITARKCAEESARASEARFQRLWDSGIVLIALSDDEGRIHDINDEGSRMLGYTRAELLGGRVRWGDIVPPDVRDESAMARRELTERGVMKPHENELIGKDGTRVPVLAGGAMLEGTMGITIAIDLSERKRVEQALRETEEQFRHAQKMEAVGRLAGGIGHDFNNALSVVLSTAELMMEDLTEGDPMHVDLEQIRTAGRRAADLTRQLLIFSRHEAIEPRIVDPNEALNGMTKMIRRLVGEDIEVDIDLEANVGGIRIDPGQFGQVIMNLVVNARDAMPTGGSLEIETSNVTLDEAFARKHLGVRPGPHVRLMFADSGSGMDKATQVRIFEPFFTTKERGKGTGLGLSTVFGIVQRSEGTIWVESAPGKGSTFIIYLPRVDGEVEAWRPPPTLATLRGSETILLVEDEDQVRAVARGILRRHGYSILEARNAGEALLIAESHSGAIDLLLADVVMPHMSGPELAKRLLATRAKLKVLCMSGYTDDSIARHGVQTPFLQKPITRETLTRKVREVLDAPDE